MATRARRRPRQTSPEYGRALRILLIGYGTREYSSHAIKMSLEKCFGPWLGNKLYTMLRLDKVLVAPDDGLGPKRYTSIVKHERIREILHERFGIKMHS